MFKLPKNGTIRALALQLSNRFITDEQSRASEPFHISIIAEKRRPSKLPKTKFRSVMEMIGLPKSNGMMPTITYRVALDPLR